MKIQTKDLTGAALDWAVATAEGLTVDNLMGGAVWVWIKDSLTGEDEHVSIFGPSTSWAQGGPILEREDMTVQPDMEAALTERHTEVYRKVGWIAHMTPTAYWMRRKHVQGTTPLIAAMRCFVASTLGDEIEVPEELK